MLLPQKAAAVAANRMASPVGALETHLVACVQHSLGVYLFDNACFLCERLVAQFPSEVRPAWFEWHCSRLSGGKQVRGQLLPACRRRRHRGCIHSP